MSTVIDLVPHIRVEDSDYTQSVDTVLEVSAFTDLGLVVNVTAFSGANVSVLLETAMENRDERYFTLRRLFQLTGPTEDFDKYAYFSGSGECDSNNPSDQWPSVARFVRIRTDGMTSGDTLTFNVKALLRSR